MSLTCAIIAMGAASLSNREYTISCNSCPHGPYWYAEWTESGKRKTKYLGKILNEIIE